MHFYFINYFSFYKASKVPPGCRLVFCSDNCLKNIFNHGQWECSDAPNINLNFDSKEISFNTNAKSIWKIFQCGTCFKQVALDGSEVTNENGVAKTYKVKANTLQVKLLYVSCCCWWWCMSVWNKGGKKLRPANLSTLIIAVTLDLSIVCVQIWQSIS